MLENEILCVFLICRETGLFYIVFAENCFKSQIFKILSNPISVQNLFTTFVVIPPCYSTYRGAQRLVVACVCTAVHIGIY